MVPKWNQNGELMVTITIKNVPPEIYERLKAQAKRNRRSINGEVISIIERALSIPPIDVKATLERTRKLRELTAHYIITNEELTRWKNEGRE
jgi:plasmid stability protein